MSGCRIMRAASEELGLGIQILINNFLHPRRSLEYISLTFTVWLQLWSISLAKKDSQLIKYLAQKLPAGRFSGSKYNFVCPKGPSGTTF